MARTPRNYDGTGRTGRELKDLLPETLKTIRDKAGQQGEEIFTYWPELLGKEMAKFTEPVSFIDGILTVHVKSATLYSLLVQHERPRLLRRLQEKFSIRGLSFRIG